MDLFERAQSKEIGKGGYKCECCCQVNSNQPKSAREEKARLHRIARRKIRGMTSKELREFING